MTENPPNTAATMEPVIYTLPVQMVRPFDSIAEGTVVNSVEVREEEVRDAPGYVEHVRVVYLDLTPARTIVAEPLSSDGKHVFHDLDRSTGDTRRYLWDDEVRVMRPGPIEPCECGFGGRR